MSKTVARILAGVVHTSTAVMKPYRRRVARALTCENLVQTVDVEANGVSLRFRATTARSLHDVLTLGRGEPETVEWIDSLQPGVLWDVGANVGLYSLYAAARGHRVIAFEPGAESFAALCRNVSLNGLGDLVSPYCIALSDHTGHGQMNMVAEGAGHSTHSLVEAAGRPFKQAALVFSATDFQRVIGVTSPDYLKIDVDGIEASVIQGAAGLRSIRSILVEAETDVARQHLGALLAPLGFTLLADPADHHPRNLVFARRQSEPALAAARR